ncbi:MAG: sulfur carrier protein ThiS [Actinomycetota bacterium]|jgi:sulfur carrier protein|nr:sulfur carrier protein ThiS [Actinomycetota bacterium]
MTVTVNGECRELSEGVTVADLVASLASGGRGVAVAVNSEVVSRSRWDGTRLRPGDRVEVLGAAQGG